MPVSPQWGVSNCSRQASNSKIAQLAGTGSRRLIPAQWFHCAVRAAPSRNFLSPSVLSKQIITHCSSNVAAESSVEAAQLLPTKPATAATAAEAPVEAAKPLLNHLTDISTSAHTATTALAVTTASAAAVSPPQITLTPLQPLNGGSVSKGSVGEWSHAAVQQGYMITRPQQRKQQQKPKHYKNHAGHGHNNHGAAKQRPRPKAASQFPLNDELQDSSLPHQDLADSSRQQSNVVNQQRQQQAGHQQQRPPRWWHVHTVLKDLSLTDHLITQRSAPGLLHLLQTAWCRRKRVNIIHLATACRVLVELQQKQQGGASVYSSSGRDELLQMVETLLTEQLTGAAAAAVAGTGQSLQASSSNSSSSNSSSSMDFQAGTPGTFEAAATAAAAPTAGEALYAVRSLSTLVYSWAKLQHKPPTEVLELLLDAFLMMYEVHQQQEQQQQQQDLLDSSCLVQEEQQQQQDLYASSEAAPGYGGSYSSSSNAGGQGSKQPSSSSSDTMKRMHSLSNLSWGLAKIGYTCNGMYGSSSSSRKTHRQQQQIERQQQNWSRLAAAATLEASLSPTAAAAAAAALSARNLSSLCYGFAAGGYKDVVLWGTLSSHVITAVDDFQPQDLSTTLWAYATAGVPHKGVFAAAAPAARQLMLGFTPQGLVNTLWAYQSALRHVPDELMAAAVDECIRRSSSSSSSSSGNDLIAFGPMHLSMLVWACGKNKIRNSILATAVCDAAGHMVDDIQAPDLCRLLHGLNVLRPANDNLYNVAESRMLSFFESGNPNIQTMVQGVAAYAKVEHPAAVTLLLPLLNLAEKQLTFLIRSGDATARLLKTLAALRYRADDFVNILAQKLLGPAAVAAKTAAAATGETAAAKTAGETAAAKTAGETAAAKTAGETAAAAATGEAAAIVDTTAAATVHHLRRWDTQALAVAAAAIAKLGHTEQTMLLRLIMQEFNVRLKAAAASSRKNSWKRKGAKANFASQSAIAAAAAAPAATSQVRLFSNGMLVHCALLLWCAAVCDMRKDMALLLPLAAAMRHADGPQLPQHSLAQLVQVHMWAQTLGPPGKALISSLPKPLMDQALTWWQIELVPATVRSTFHSEVLAELTSMKLRPVTEGVTPDGMFSVDCIVKFKGCEVALEVMGDQHYSVNQIVTTMHKGMRKDTQQQQQGQRRRRKQQEQGLVGDGEGTKPKHVLLGPDALRMRLLAARGYAVAAVSSFEWETVRRRGNGQELLLQKLQEAVQKHRAAAAAATRGQKKVFDSKAADHQHQSSRRGESKQRQQRPLFKHLGDQASDALGSSTEPPQQQQQQQQQQEQEGVPDVVQQVAHVLQQQGRSDALMKGKLKRQQYWQQRQATDRDGMMLLTMAAPWAAAKDASGSSSSSGESKEEDASADSSDSSVQDTTVSVFSDEDFNMSLDLEDLLLE